MSLFVDLRQLRTSVTNLSEMVDKMTETGRGRVTEEKHTQKSDGTSFFSSSIFKPTTSTLGLGVRFSQSQEDVCRGAPSSRLRSHTSMPDLEKEDTFQRPTTSHRPKIVELDDDDGGDASARNVVHLSTENLNGLILASVGRRPRYDDSGDIHPMDFLDDVRYYIAEIDLAPEKRLPFVISCLDGVPLLWARCFRGEFKSVEGFYRAFEQEFWSGDRQKAVLYDMKLGKYDDAGARTTMSEYFLQKVSNYKRLTPPPSDLEIVYSLAAHFPSAVELELRLSQRPSLRDAYRVLRRREGEAPDSLPNYLYDMCEAFQRGLQPESARRRDAAAGTTRSAPETQRDKK
ncbi:hypothetical protein EVAR_39808_1 [Eumeta japonica]|uniref:Uncharacterized protein n=1 Tax=Eumeta variegata TaxID=151549 RepID=A0A4C1X908_EUMVA|nr:hypothetical protein EVAR_39808_1 [Eumeta japonica]